MVLKPLPISLKPLPISLKPLPTSIARTPDIVCLRVPAGAARELCCSGGRRRHGRAVFVVDGSAFCARAASGRNLTDH
eukprot:1560329-Pleurochrysis_carterae.AAC.1